MFYKDEPIQFIGLGCENEEDYVEGSKILTECNEKLTRDNRLKKLELENKKLNNNWNELEKWLKTTIEKTKDENIFLWHDEELDYLIQRRNDLKDVLHKMQEIKEGKNE